MAAEETMHTREERKRDWKSILGEEGDREAERSPGALNPARRNSCWSGVESRMMNDNSWDRKGTMMWREINGQTTWRP